MITGFSILGLPVVYWWIKLAFFEKTHPANFMRSAAVATFVAGFLAMS